MNSPLDATHGRSAPLPPSMVDVAVIGGGIVGAAAALGAAQAGLSTVWIAGRDAPAPSSSAVEAAAHLIDRDVRVYAISPATQRFLERLRVWSQLDEARLAAVFDMRVFGDREGRSALHFGAYEAATERLATIVEHRALARVLDTAAGYFPGLERIDGFASKVATDAAFATIATERGPRRARLVVAADGAASPTRASLGIVVHTKPYEQRAVVGNFVCARPHAGTAFQWFTDEGVIALLPLPDIEGVHAVSLVWSAPNERADALMRDGSSALAARLSHLVSDRAHCHIGPLEAAGPVASIPLSLQYAKHLIAERGVLVGDAAHVVHPLAGQGLNLGLQDVAVLIDLLVAREPFRDCGDAVLLRRYARARAEPVSAMRHMTDGLARLFASEQPLVAGLRGVGMQIVDRIAPLKRALVRQASGSS